MAEVKPVPAASPEAATAGDTNAVAGPRNRNRRDLGSQPAPVVPAEGGKSVGFRGGVESATEGNILAPEGGEAREIDPSELNIALHGITHHQGYDVVTDEDNEETKIYVEPGKEDAADTVFIPSLKADLKEAKTDKALTEEILLVGITEYTGAKKPTNGADPLKEKDYYSLTETEVVERAIHITTYTEGAEQNLRQGKFLKVWIGPNPGFRNHPLLLKVGRGRIITLALDVIYDLLLEGAHLYYAPDATNADTVTYEENYSHKLVIDYSAEKPTITTVEKLLEGVEAKKTAEKNEKLAQVKLQLEAAFKVKDDIASEETLRALPNYKHASTLEIIRELERDNASVTGGIHGLILEAEKLGATEEDVKGYKVKNEEIKLAFAKLLLALKKKK